MYYPKKLYLNFTLIIVTLIMPLCFCSVVNFFSYLFPFDSNIANDEDEKKFVHIYILKVLQFSDIMIL